MIAHALQCPTCGARLTVSDAAPKVVTCPRCLHRLRNPNAADATSAAGAIPAPPIPMRVLPLESQASGDAGITNAMLVLLIVLLALGAFVSAATLGVASSVFNFLIVALVLAFSVTVIVASYQSEKRRREIETGVAKAPPPAPIDRGRVLMYESTYQREPTNAWAATGGFFSAIAICGGGFFLLAATVDLSGTSTNVSRSERGFFLLLVVSAVIAFMIGTPILARRSGWKGFGAGAAIGLVLGLLALGPCAFCYLLTLG